MGKGDLLAVMMMPLFFVPSAHSYATWMLLASGGKIGKMLPLRIIAARYASISGRWCVQPLRPCSKAPAVNRQMLEGVGRRSSAIAWVTVCQIGKPLIA